MREVAEATEHFREKSKCRFSPTPSVVPEDAQSAEHVSSDGMSHSDGQGDEDSEGGNGANVSQVPPNVGSSKRRCVVPVLEGVISRGLPTVDVLAQDRVSRVIPKMTSIGLKRLSKRNPTMKPQTVFFER